MAMNDEAALLATIRDKPDDDTPRKVYADFVEEREGPGDAEFAEFVRVQIRVPELFRHRPTTGVTTAMRNPLIDWRVTWDALRSRERELWPAVRGRFEGAGWTQVYSPEATKSELQHDPTKPVLIVSRGLPAEVRGPLAVLVGDSRTPGIVAELRRRWPVVRAVATDTRWVPASGGRMSSLELPSGHGRIVSPKLLIGHDTQSAAIDALSDAIIALADGVNAKGAEHAPR